MEAFFLLFLSIVVISPVIVTGKLNNYEVVFEWKQIDYDFPNDTIRQEFLKNGSFVPVNCVPNGVKVYDDLVFIATPRYLNGVPSTLNVIPYGHSASNVSTAGKEGPKLVPFPSWEMQEVGNCSALQLVHSMELDPYNRLWIVDVGRVKPLTPQGENPCPAKLLIYDLLTNKVDRTYIFPEDMIPRGTNCMKDIQVVCTSRDDCFSYIANMNATCFLAVYDYRHNDSWVATHSTMQPDFTKATVTIDGVTTMMPFGLVGLGVTPKSTNYSTLYYSKIAGDHVYALSTAVLQDGATLKENPIISDDKVKDYGAKSWGQADGTAMDHKGRWYMGSLPESALYSVDTNSVNITEQLKVNTLLVQNTSELQYPDSFSFDGRGNLVLTTTRFHRFVAGKVDPNAINYRLVKIKTDSFAYNT